ncbi:MAG: PqqD family protein [Bryobacterales bacterium]|nr:PqqD family protein [Bryobacterales bacterium]
MIGDTTQFVASQRLAASDIDGEVVVLNLRNGNYYGLNPVAAEVWRWLQEPRTLDQLISLVTAEFEVTPDRARQEITQLLLDLQARQLIEVTA